MNLTSQYYVYQHTSQLSLPLRREKAIVSKTVEEIATTPDDYLSISRLMVGTVKKRIYTSPEDNYWLLEKLITLTKERVPKIDYVVCAIEMPGCCRLPDTLLAEDVFLVTELTYDRDVLLAEGLTILCIENNLIRDPVENQSNHLCLSLYTKNDCSISWQKITQKLTYFGLNEVVL